MRTYVMAVAATAGIMAAAAGLRASGSAIPTLDTFRDAAVTDTVGGTITSTYQPRQIQLGVKFYF